MQNNIKINTLKISRGLSHTAVLKKLTNLRKIFVEWALEHFTTTIGKITQ